MELCKFLLPLLDKCRERFGDWSLVLRLEYVKIGIPDVIEHHHRKLHRRLMSAMEKQSVEEADDGEWLKIVCGTTPIICTALTNATPHWRTKPCVDLDDLRKNMMQFEVNVRKIDEGSRSLPSSVYTASFWKDVNGSATLLVAEFVGTECLIDDETIASLIQYTIDKHLGQKRDFLVRTIRRIVFPVAIHQKISIYCVTSGVRRLNVGLFDQNGLQLGELIDLKHCKPENYKSKFPNEPPENFQQWVDLYKHKGQISTVLGRKSILQLLYAIVSKHVRNVDHFVDDSTSFVSLGFDSFTLASIEFALKSALEPQIKIPYGVAYRFQSVQSLADYLLANQSNQTDYGNEKGAEKLPEHDPADMAKRNCKIPLSAAQKRLFFLAKFNTKDDNSGSSGYNNDNSNGDHDHSDDHNNETEFSIELTRFTLRIEFDIYELNIRRFTVAFNRVVARQTALRTHYQLDGQQILSLTEAYFCGEPHRSAAIIQNIVPLSTVPMLMQLIAKFNNRTQPQLRYHLVIVQHHVMTDGQSVRILARELQRCYRRPDRSLGALDYHFANFALDESNQSSIRLAQYTSVCRTHWLQMFSKRMQTEPLPSDWPRSSSANYHGVQVTIEFSDAEFEQIQKLSRRYDVTQFYVLLTLYFLLVNRQYGLSQYCVGLAASERSIRPELKDLIGYLVNALPICVHIDQSSRIDEFFGKIKDILSRSLQYSIPFDELIQILRIEPEVEPAMPLFQVLLVMDDGDDYDNSDDNDDDSEDDYINSNDSSRNNSFTDSLTAAVALADDTLKISASDFDWQESNFAKYDQVWYFTHKRSQKLEIRVEFNAALYHHTTIEQSLRYYRQLLTEACRRANGDTLAELLSLGNLAQKIHHYQTFLVNQTDFVRKRTILRLIADQQLQTPYGDCVISRGIHFSSIFVDAWCTKVAEKFLRQRLQHYGESVRVDCYAVVIVERSVQLIVLILALWRCGVAPIPLSVDWPTERFVSVIADLNYPMVIARRKLLDEKILRERELSWSQHDWSKCLYLDVDQLCKHCSTTQSGQRSSSQKFRNTEFDLAYLTYTSGSTGTPKGICTAFQGLNNLAAVYCRELFLQANINVYQVVTPSFDIFFADIIEAFTNGGSLTLATERIPNSAEMHDVTHAYIMPAYLSAIDGCSTGKNVLCQLHAVHFGGDVIQARTLTNLVNGGVRLWQQYGLSEHTIYVTFKRMRNGDRAFCVGRPFSNVNLAIACDNDNSCSRICCIQEKRRGICLTSGVGLCRGYYRGLNAHAFPACDTVGVELTHEKRLLLDDHRCFYTGDNVEIRRCRQSIELYFCGRCDTQVKIRGVRVDVTEIEHQLCTTVSFIKDCVVCAQTVTADDQMLLIAYITLSIRVTTTARGEHQFLCDTLKSQLDRQLKSKLPMFMLPNHYIVMQSFPLSSNGKIDRKLLPKIPVIILNDGYHIQKLDSSNKRTVLSEREEQIFDCFCRVLGISKTNLELDNSFFAVGGNSLKGLLVIQQLEHQQPDLPLDISDIFRLRTFRRIIEHIRSNAPEKHKHEDRGVEKLESSRQCSRRSTVQDLCIKEADKVESSAKKLDSSIYSNSGLPLSSAQQRLLFLHQVDQDHAYIMHFRIKLRGSVSVRLLNWTHNYLMSKHRALRTVFQLPGSLSGVQFALSLTESYVHLMTITYNRIDMDFDLFNLDLAHSPPVKFALEPVSTINDSFVLNLIIHHIIIDGRSFAILAQDLSEIYTDLAAGRSIQRCQLIEKLVDEEFRLSDDDDAYISWLIKKLEVVQCLRVPYDYEPVRANLHGSDVNLAIRKRSLNTANTIAMKLDVPLNRLEELCAQYNCTKFAFLLAVFAVQMREVTAQETFALVTSSANRRMETMKKVGCYVNPLILLVHTSADTGFRTFADLSRDLHSTVIEALKHQHIPYEHIIERLRPKRPTYVTSDMPPFSIAFVLHNFSTSSLPTAGGVQFDVLEQPSKYAKYEQTWSLIEHSNSNDDGIQIQLSVEYARELYKRERIMAYMEMFAHLLRTAVNSIPTITRLSDELRRYQVALSRKLNLNIDYFDGKVTSKIPEIDEHNSKAFNGRQQSMVAVIQQKLLKLWSKTLETNKITIDDNFFALGGHSLLIPRICSQIEDLLGLECSPVALYEQQTIRRLADHIYSKHRAVIDASTDINLMKPEIMKITEKPYNYLHACELQLPVLDLYLNAANDRQRLRAYENGFIIQIFSASENLTKSLKRALNKLIVHHQSLRTMFVEHNGEKFQQIFSATECYLTLQSHPNPSDSNVSPPIVPNPFKTVPLVSWISPDNADRFEHQVDIESKELLNKATMLFALRLSHVICDGRSLKLIADQLRTLICHPATAISDQPKITRDYAQFTEDFSQRLRQKREQNERFWHTIATKIALLQQRQIKLEFDKICPRNSSYLAGCARRIFNGLYKIIDEIARKYGCSRFVVMLAAFAKMLTDRQWETGEVVLSFPLDMRKPLLDSNSVGHYVHTLPVVLDVVQAQTVAGQLRNAAESIAEVIAHAEIAPYQVDQILGDDIEPYKMMIVDDHNISIDKEQQHQQQNQQKWKLSNFRVVDDDSEYTKCDLCLFVSNYGPNLIAKLEYNTALFYAKSVQLLLEQWVRNIYHMSRGTINDSARDFWFSSPENQNEFPKISYPHLLQNTFITGCGPRDSSLHFSGNRTAFFNEHTRLCYSQLRARVTRLSYALGQLVLQNLGETLRPDMVVPIVATGKSLDSLLICLAVMYAGAAYLPIDCTNPRKRIVEILVQSGATMYLHNFDADGNCKGDLSSKEGTVSIQIDQLLAAYTKRRNARHRLHSSIRDLAYVIFTSGTSGSPKGIAIGQRGLLNVAVASTWHFMMSSGDCVYQFTNFAFDNSVLEYTMALANSCSLYVDDDQQLRPQLFDALTFIERIRQHHITHALLFPGLVATFKRSQIAALAELRYWIVGAERLQQHILALAIEHGVHVVQNYGPTESTTFALSRPMHRLDRANNIGMPIGNTQIWIAAPGTSCSRKSMPRMAPGNLYVQSVGVMRGYIGQIKADRLKNSPNSSSFAIRNLLDAGMYNTGDVVKMLPDNSVLFLGRQDLQVKVRGFRVNLEEIETVLCGHSGVQAAKLYQQAHDQQLIAFVVAAESNQQHQIEATELREYLVERLPHYMIPAQFRFLHHLPLTKNAKVDHKMIGTLAVANSGQSQHVRGICEPETVLEFRLLLLFRKVIGCETSIAVTDDFFAIGGNSLRAIHLAEMFVAERLVQRSEVAQQIIFEERTVKKLAARLKFSASGAEQPETGIQTQQQVQVVSGTESFRDHLFKIPLSYQQQQMNYLLECDRMQQQHYRLVFAQRFSTQNRFVWLQRAFLRLVMRQHCLRTTFPVSEDDFEPQQMLLSGTECYHWLPESVQIINAQQLTNTDAESHHSISDATDDGSDIDKVLEMIGELRVQARNLDPLSQPLICTGSLLHSGSKGDYAIVLLISHMISDAWSTRLLELELTTHYASMSAHDGHKFNDQKLAHNYLEYSIVQHQQHDWLLAFGAECAEKIVQARCFGVTLGKVPRDSGIQNLTIESTPLTMDGDFPPPPMCVANYTMCEFKIPAAKVEQPCGTLLCTPFVVILGANLLAIHSFFRLERLIVLTPVANRTAQTDCIIGNFLNNLLISSDCSAVLHKETGICCLTKTEVCNYLNTLNANINEIRRFERLPYVILIDCISQLLRSSNSQLTIDSGCFEQILFNFRYELESNTENGLSDDRIAELLPPPPCAHKIEIDVDLLDRRYRIRLRIHSEIGGTLECDRLRGEVLHYLSMMLQMASSSEWHHPSQEIDWGNKNKISPSTDSNMPVAKTNHQSVLAKKLWRIWSECLGHKISKHPDDFFIEGGNSILLLRLRRMIVAKLGVNLHLSDLLEHRHFTQMLELLDAAYQQDLTGNAITATEPKSESMRHGGMSDARFDYVMPSALKTFSAVNIHTERYLVFFHPLIGGVTLPYAPLIRELIIALGDHWRLLGLEHPNSFVNRCRNAYLTESVETLCAFYAQQLLGNTIQNAKICIFVGASLGASLAYETAQQLLAKGTHIERIISIDGAATISRKPMISYTEHCAQMAAVIERRRHVVDSRIRLAMLENSWLLLNMAYRYAPKSNKNLQVTVLKACKILNDGDDDFGDDANNNDDDDGSDKNSDINGTIDRNNDLGWGTLCQAHVIRMRTNHTAMLEEQFAPTLAKLIVSVALELKDD